VSHDGAAVEGRGVGVNEGYPDGTNVEGVPVGVCVGALVGSFVGLRVGRGLGMDVGRLDGAAEGAYVGNGAGSAVGPDLQTTGSIAEQNRERFDADANDGAAVEGSGVGVNDGQDVGSRVGRLVGRGEGTTVGNDDGAAVLGGADGSAVEGGPRARPGRRRRRRRRRAPRMRRAESGGCGRPSARTIERRGGPACTMKVSVAGARELASKSRGSPMEHRFRRRASNFDERASCRDIRMPRRLLHKSWTPRMRGRRARRTLEVTEAGQKTHGGSAG